MRDEIARLRQRAMRPARPRLADVVAAAYGWDAEVVREWLATSGSEDAVIEQIAASGIPGREDTPGPDALWEALAAREVIPAAWLDAGQHRRFADPGEAYPPAFGRTDVEFDDAVEVPPTVLSCLAFASDVEAITTVEALAQELVSALAPWGVPVPSRVIWTVDTPNEVQVLPLLPVSYYVLPDARPGRAFLAAPCLAAAAALVRAGERLEGRASAEEIRYFGDGRVSVPSARAWRELARASQDWQRAVALSVAVPCDQLGSAIVAPAVQGRLFGDLPDPYEPLIAIWQLGYVVADVRDDAIVLAAPWPAANASEAPP